MAKPVVDGLERELRGRAAVYRLNVSSAETVEVAGYYGLRGLPTLLVLDGQGELVLRQVGRLQKDAVLSAVAEIEASKTD